MATPSERVTDPLFKKWTESRRFKHPDTGNDVLFKSLPKEEQDRIRERWRQRSEQEPSTEKSEPARYVEERQRRNRSFGRWLGEQDPAVIKRWKKNRYTGDRSNIDQIYQKEDKDPYRELSRKEREQKETRFKEFLKKKGPEAQKAWAEGDLDKIIDLSSEFSEQEKKRKKEIEEKHRKEWEEAEKKRKEELRKKEDKETKDNPNIDPKAKIKNSLVRGKVTGSSVLKDSNVERGSTVNSVNLNRSSVKYGSTVTDSRLDRSRINRSTVTGSDLKKVTATDAQISNCDLSNMRIFGGVWDGVKLQGSGGTYHRSYDPKTLQILSRPRFSSQLDSLDERLPPLGDAPINAILQYLNDGGRLKGWLGKKLDRKTLQKKIRNHIYENYQNPPKNKHTGQPPLMWTPPNFVRGLQLFSDLSDEDFFHLISAAEKLSNKHKNSEKTKRAMLQHLRTLAHKHPEFSSDLAPLLRTGLKTAQEDSLRKCVIKLAFTTHSSTLKQLLLQCLKNASSLEEKTLKLDPKLFVETTAWDNGVSPNEYRQVTRIAYETTDSNKRHRLVSVLKQAKYNPGFLKWVEKQKWKHPNTGNMVEFVSLPFSEQKKIHKQWKAGKKDWAQKFKPEGLDESTQLTPEKFDKLKTGDELWISWAPYAPHLVTGFEKTKTGKPVLVMEIKTPKGDIETRYMHRSTAGNPDHEIHILPPGAEIKHPNKKAPKTEKAEQPSKHPEKLDSSKGEDPVSILKEMNDSAKDWLNKPGLPGAGAVLTDKLIPGYHSGDVIEISDTSQEIPPSRYKVLSNKLVKGPNGTGILAKALFIKGAQPTIIPLGNKYAPSTIKNVTQTTSEPEESDAVDNTSAPKKKAPAPEKAPAPATGGKYKDRKELFGKGKADTHPVSITQKDLAIFTPEGLNEDAKKATHEGFKGITYKKLKDLENNIKVAVEDPEGPYAKALMQSGYTKEGLAEMHKSLQKLLDSQKGRRYNNTVLQIANKYDLEGEDADELYGFKIDKPFYGKKLTDQELFQKFLAHAKPETRERMQGMSLDDFMVMYKSILLDDDDEDEETSE